MAKWTSAAALAACALLGCRMSSSGREPAAEPFVARQLELDGSVHRYQVFLPRGERPAAGWPVLLFLHGSGECGDDGARQAAIGLGPALVRDPAAHPFVAVLPQAVCGQVWGVAMERVALAALEAAVAERGGDPMRLYLVGMSMGGNGVLRIAARHPGRFAAVIAVCAFPTVPGRENLTASERAAYLADNPFAGAADPFVAAARALATTPLWLAHGAEDSVVPVASSRSLYRELLALGAPVHYVEYPGVGHDVWDAAFAEPELWRWLAARHR